jgi:hypothetical protein
MQQFQALKLSERVILVAGVVMFITSFLPWYSVDLGPLGDFTRNGWQSPGALWSILAALIGVGMAGIVAGASFAGMRMPELAPGMTWGRIFLAGGIASLVLVIIKWINENDFLGFGFYIGFIAAIGLAIGGFLAYQEETGRR